MTARIITAAATNDKGDEDGIGWRSVIVLGAVFVALAPIAVYARLGTVVLLIAALAAQQSLRAGDAALRAFSAHVTVRLGAMLALWAAVTLTWAEDPSPATLFRVCLVAVMALLLVAAVQKLTQRDAVRLANIAMIGGILMLVLLGAEVWSGGLVLAWTHPDEIVVSPAVWTAPIKETIARGGAVLAPLTFAYALLIYARTKRAWLSLLLMAATLALCASSVMDTAWLALVAGAIAFVVARAAPRFALIGLFGGLILYAVIAPWLSTTVLTLDGIDDLGRVPWRGTEQRIGIWHHVAGLVAERPLTGYGFDAARTLAKAEATVPGTNWPALPLHPHNAIMQIWLELGAIGIALVIAILATAARALWPMTARPLHLAATLATITGTAVLALASFGIWQYWWLAAWGFVAAVLVLALRVAPPGPGSEAGGG